MNRRALSRAGVPSGKNHSVDPRILSLLLLPALLALACTAEAAKVRVVVESPGGLQQNVYLTRPLGLEPDRPVVFVIHGAGQTASEARDRWHDLSVEHDFLLVVPEFEGWNFPDTADYSLGNLVDAQGRLVPADERFFAMIEAIFADVRRRYGLSAASYAIYGDGAGAQFVQRFLYLVPDARITQAVAGCADWYTMPVFDSRFPYGLRGTGVSPDQLAQALRRPLTILLCEEGIDAQPAGTEWPPEVLAQGASRQARGRAFHAAGRDAATALGVSMGWTLATAAGAESPDGLALAEAAIPYLLPP